MSQEKQHVLVVEDSLEEVYMIRALLEAAGVFQITLAQDGHQAARLISERDWGLIVCDLNLPGVDGYDLIRTVRTAGYALDTTAA